MDHIIFVRVSNCVGDLDTVFDDHVVGKSDIRGDGTGQHLPLNKFHDNAGLARLFYYVFDPADIGVVQRRSNTGLGVELAAGILVGNGVFAHQFDGDHASECGIPGAVNNTHAAHGQQLSQLVTAEGSTR